MKRTGCRSPVRLAMEFLGCRGLGGENEVTREMTLLLGEDHLVYGDCAVHVHASGRSACAMSPGAAPATTSRYLASNEDALLLIDEGDATLMAVADGHFGGTASHALLRRLERVMASIPRNPAQLLAAIADSTELAGDGGAASETTLVVAVWDRQGQVGFGASFGDSTVMVIGLQGPPVTVSMKNDRYVSPFAAATLDPSRAVEFSFQAHPGDLLLAFSDGLDECHYRSPETSVRPRHLKSLWAESGASPERFVQKAVELALAGVDGNPGGEDNVAVVATLA